jgi:hypothetical protein
LSEQKTIETPWITTSHRFVALEGVTNPNTGALRGILFLLVLLTTALSALFINIATAKPTPRSRA